MRGDGQFSQRWSQMAWHKAFNLEGVKGTLHLTMVMYIYTVHTYLIYVFIRIYAHIYKIFWIWETTMIKR